MINPTPVSPSRSPYTQKTKRGLPKSIAATPKKKRGPGFTWKKLFIFSFVLLVLSSATYVYAQLNSLKNSVIVEHKGSNSSILGSDPNALDASQFKKAGDGRFNIVMVGIGGANHPGGNLTDSIQVMSIDTINKKAGITSIPRDLYVKLPSGNWAKINSVYSNAEAEETGQGGFALRQAVGEVLGITVSNFVMVDFDGAKDLVDALGGIDVNVPTSIYDPYFPDDATVGYSPFRIQAGEQHMNGTTALRYSRSRETTSDFDRSARQQLVIAAIKEKALSLGTLSNPAKVSAMRSTLGGHLKTDLQLDDLATLMSIYKDIPSDATTTFVLDTTAKLGLLTSSSNTGAGYISYPIAGMGDYSEIHNWFQKNNPDPLITKEGATITVIPGESATNKETEQLVQTLQDYGYNATLGSQNYSDDGEKTRIYDTSKGKKPVTDNYLSSFFNISSQNGSPLGSGSDFEIIYNP